VSASPPQVETSLASFLLAAAQRRAAAQDHAGALVLLEELLREAPEHVSALRLVAELQVAENPVAAANAAHRIVQDDPGDHQAWELLARALSAMGRHDEAVEAVHRGPAGGSGQPREPCGFADASRAAA
jgi:predicted Zn-dependent protease